MELDQFRDVDLVIDRANDSFVQKQFVSQGDYKGRSLTVQVTNNGSVGEVPGLTLNLRWHNEASGLTDLSAFSVVDKSNSIFRIEYPQNMMTPGKVFASVQILQNGKTTQLKEFELTVQQLAGQAVGIAQQAEFSALVAVLSDANKFRSDIDTLDKNKAEKSYVDTMISSVAQGGPRELFYSITALKTKYPNGEQGTYLVFDTSLADEAHSFMWNGTSWVDLGPYQSASVPLRSVNIPRTTFINPKVNGLLTTTVERLNANLSSGTQVSSESLSNVCVFFPISGGKQYGFRKLSSSYFVVATTANKPTFGTPLIDRINLQGGSTGELTTSASANYMIIWLYNSTADNISFDEIYSSLIVVEGNANDAYYVLDDSIKTDPNNLKEKSIPYSKMEKSVIEVFEENKVAQNELISNLPISKYQAIFKNNLAIDRTDDIIKLKVEFQDNECMYPENIEVIVDGQRKDFEWMPNYDEYDMANLSNHIYPSGFLRSGYLVFIQPLQSLEEKTATINVYAKKVSSFTESNITTTTTNTAVNIIAGKLNVNGNGRIQIMRYDGTRLNRSSVGDLDYLQMIDESDNRVTLSYGNIIKMFEFGSGKIFKRFVWIFKSNLSGINLIYTLTVYRNEKVEVNRSVIFDAYVKQVKGLRFRQQFYSADFIATPLSYETYSDNLKSIGGPISGINGVLTCKFLQMIPNGGKDGFNGDQLTTGAVDTVTGTDVMVGALAESVNILSGKTYIPTSGDSFTLNLVYQFASDTLKNIEQRNMNPITAQATKTLRRNSLREIKSMLETFVDNNYDAAKNMDTFKGISVLVEIINAKVNDVIPEKLVTINQKFDTFVSFYGSAANIYTLYQGGRGIEYTGRDAACLKDIIKFYEENGDAVRVQKARDLATAFTEFYVKVEEFSGKDGNVFLQPTSTYSALNAMAAALNALYYSKNYNGGLTNDQQECLTRIETLFLSSARHRNILPYGYSSGVLNNITYHYKLHYHAFSLFDYLWNKNDIPAEIDVTSYINDFVTPIGKIEEFGATFQSTRRGLGHTNLYCAGILLKKGDISSLETAKKLIENLLRNCFPDGTKNQVVSPWKTNVSVPHNLAIEMQVAAELLFAINV